MRFFIFLSIVVSTFISTLVAADQPIIHLPYHNGVIKRCNQPNEYYGQDASHNAPGTLYALDLDTRNDADEILVAGASGVAYVHLGSTGYGNHVNIDLGNNLFLVNAHFKSITITNGEYVCLGQDLGIEGCSGRCDGDHVHFGIQQGNPAQNAGSSSSVPMERIWSRHDVVTESFHLLPSTAFVYGFMYESGNPGIGLFADSSTNDFTESVRSIYQINGGPNILGFPITPLQPWVLDTAAHPQDERWVGSYIQEFSGGSVGDCAIIANKDTGHSYVMHGQFWNLFRYGLGDGVFGPTISVCGTSLGFPTSAEYNDGIGFTWQDFTQGAIAWDGLNVHLYLPGHLYAYTATANGPQIQLEQIGRTPTSLSVSILPLAGIYTHNLYCNGLPILISQPLSQGLGFKTTGAAQQLVINDLVPDTPYDLQVIGYDGSGVSLGYSNLVRTATAGDGQTPFVLSAWPVGSDGIWVTFTTIPTATSYDINLDGFRRATINQPGTTVVDYQMYDLLPGHTYLVSVTALNGSGVQVARSTTVQVVLPPLSTPSPTPSPTPTPVPDLRATNITVVDPVTRQPLTQFCQGLTASARGIMVVQYATVPQVVVQFQRNGSAFATQMLTNVAPGTYTIEANASYTNDGISDSIRLWVDPANLVGETSDGNNIAAVTVTYSQNCTPTPTPSPTPGIQLSISQIGSNKAYLTYSDDPVSKNISIERNGVVVYSFDNSGHSQTTWTYLNTGLSAGNTYQYQVKSWLNNFTMLSQVSAIVTFVIATPTPSPTTTPVVTISPTPSASPTASPTRSPTPSPSSSPTPTTTPTPSVSPTQTPTPSPTASKTPTKSPTPTVTPTKTPTVSPSPTASVTPTKTASPTPSKTPSPTASATPTSSPSLSPTRTPSPTPSASPSPTPVLGRVTIFDDSFTGSWKSVWTPSKSKVGTPVVDVLADRLRFTANTATATWGSLGLTVNKKGMPDLLPYTNVQVTITWQVTSSTTGSNGRFRWLQGGTWYAVGCNTTTWLTTTFNLPESVAQTVGGKLELRYDLSNTTGQTFLVDRITITGAPR